MSFLRSILADAGNYLSEVAQRPTTQGVVGGAAGVYSIWQNVASFSAQLAGFLGGIMTVWAFCRWCRERYREYRQERDKSRPTL